MNYPRTHIFVDAQCPALVKGQLTAWSKPGDLVAVLSPEQLNFSPDDASSMRAIRGYRSNRDPNIKEVHLIIEGSPPPTLLIGLSNYITDIIHLEGDKHSEIVDELNAAIEQYQYILSFYEDLLVSTEDFFGRLNKIEEDLGEDLDIHADGLTYLGDEWTRDLKKALTVTVDAFVSQTKDHSRDGFNSQVEKAA
jgi:hypothetical protein